MRRWIIWVIRSRVEGETYRVDVVPPRLAIGPQDVAAEIFEVLHVMSLDQEITTRFQL
jgi:hypothetical protein